MESQEVSHEETRKLRGDKVVKASYDDHPNETAERFVRFLESKGFTVVCKYNNDIPDLYYEITDPK